MTAPSPAPRVAASPATTPSTNAVAPSSPVTPYAATPSSADILIAGRRVARLGDRLIALVLDTLLVAAVFALCGMWIAARWGGITKNGFALEGKSAVLTFIATLVLAWLYFWIMEGIFGATLGKAIIGIQVRNKNGERCDIRASLIRNLVRIVDGIGIYLVGFLIAIFSKLRQRLGDHVANTVVVETRIGRLARFVLVLLWVGSIIAGMWGAYRIHSGVTVSPKREAIQPTGYNKEVAALSHSILLVIRLETWE
jgi:uncharacterized RDD family membrane protein YckC